MSSPAFQPLVITRRLADGTIDWVTLEIPHRLPVEPGAAYALIDRAIYEAPPTLEVHRQGDDLVLEVQGNEVVVLGGFFSTADVTFHPTTDIAGGDGPFAGPPLTPDSPLLAGFPPGEQVVWSAEDERIASSEADEQSTSPAEVEEDSGGSPLLWGGVALGGLGLLAAAAGGGGGGGGGGSSTPPTPPPPVQRTIDGTVVAGPVIDGNGLSVRAFRADGTTQLGEARVTSDGSFSINIGDYTGVVIARVIDADNGEDYLDEASLANKDLNAELSAVMAAGGTTSTLLMNINPVTTLAASLAAQEAGGAAPTLAQVNQSNTAVATLFGLSDLHTVLVVPINGAGYDASNGLSAGESYGAMLAAFSGATLDNGGDSQQTIDEVLAGLTLSGNAAVLSESAQALLIEGAQTTETETGEDLSGFVSSVLDTVAPAITSGATAPDVSENSGGGQVVYTAIATDASEVTFSLSPVSDAAAFSIDASTGAVTLTNNPDFETQPSYAFTVVATDTAGNSAEQAVTLDILDRDDSAPFITSGGTAAPIEENSGANQVIYTATATDEGPVTWTLKTGGDAADFSINATTGEVRLTGDPDHETQSSYTFTVVATDNESNIAEQAVSLAIVDLDDAPPTITSGATAPAIDENSVSNQPIYTVTATDGGDISNGVTFSLSPGGDSAAFTINANSGVVRLIASPDFETKSSYNFTVVATDAALNSDSQAVSLAINNLDEAAPNITSGATATAINENGAPNQAVYTVAATDGGDISNGVTFSLSPGGDSAAFTINANSGVVRLIASPDFETKSSYNFTVVATDAALNSDSQAVSLAIINLDEVAPNITSGATAPAIDENSVANQVIYTVTATDAGDISNGVTFSLSPGADAAAFTINANTGVVRLIASPDFETKSSYNFTVVATDAALNSDSQAVSLSINDIADETAPTVTSVALTGATGAQNNTLNAGDIATVTVAMSENVTVNTTGGTPRIALAMGGSTVFASFASGSGSPALLFEYTVQPGDNDNDGISIPTNGLQANGGTLQDTTGNTAVLSHGSVASNASFLVDTNAPTLTSSTPADNTTGVILGADIVLTFSEPVQAGSGNITISDGAGDTRVIAVTDVTQVGVSGNTLTINPAADLNDDSAYSVQIASGALTDAAGNTYAGISDNTTFNFETVDTSIVVFDLLQGSSSAHSGRTFDGGVSYDIYVRVDSDSASLSTAGGGPGTWGTWSGAANLGSDDRIILVGDGANVVRVGPVATVSVNATEVAWQQTLLSLTAASVQGQTFERFTGFPANSDQAVLFDAPLPGTFLSGQGGVLNTMYQTNMPGGILTSQGLV